MNEQPAAQIAAGLRQVVRKGIPVQPDAAPDSLLSLQSVTAHSVDPTSPAARTDALERLLRSELNRFALPDLKPAAKVLFGIGALGTNLTSRRELAAERSGFNEDHFRKRVEPKIVEQLAWQIARSELQHTSRTYGAEPLAPSGRTPVIQPEDFADPVAAEKEMLVSKIWSEVYGLRAELIRREATKIEEEGDETTEEHHPGAAEVVDAETGVRWRMARLLTLLDSWIEQYGQEILHGEAEFNAEALIRLAGWTGELTDEQARELRFRLRRVDEWDRASFR